MKSNFYFSDSVFDIYCFFKKRYSIYKWKRSDKQTLPPHGIKQDAILQIKDVSGIDVFVETGTYKGNMIWAVRNCFNEIYTIELNKTLASEASKRFEKFNHVEVIQGNSGEVLFDLVPKIKKPAIFWLDGHYSGGITSKGDKDCPIYEELEAIFKSGLNHILLIDDARLFVGKNDYPTFAELKKTILEVYPKSKIEIIHDFIKVEIIL